MSEQIRRCVGSIIFVPDRRRFGDLYVRIRTIIRLFLILAQKHPAVFYSGIFFVFGISRITVTRFSCSVLNGDLVSL